MLYVQEVLPFILKTYVKRKAKRGFVFATVLLLALPLLLGLSFFQDTFSTLLQEEKNETEYWEVRSASFKAHQILKDRLLSDIDLLGTPLSPSSASSSADLLVALGGENEKEFLYHSGKATVSTKIFTLDYTPVSGFQGDSFLPLMPAVSTVYLGPSGSFEVKSKRYYLIRSETILPEKREQKYNSEECVVLFWDLTQGVTRIKTVFFKSNRQ